MKENGEGNQRNVQGWAKKENNLRMIIYFDDLTEEAKKRAQEAGPFFNPSYNDIIPKAQKRLKQEVTDQLKNSLGAGNAPDVIFEQVALDILNASAYSAHFSVDVLTDLGATLDTTVCCSADEDVKRRVNNVKLIIGGLEYMMTNNSECPAAKLATRVLTELHPIYLHMKESVEEWERAKLESAQMSLANCSIVYVQERLEDHLAIIGVRKGGDYVEGTARIEHNLQDKIKPGDRVIISKDGTIKKILKPKQTKKPLAEKPKVTFENDIGGLEKEIEEIKDVLSVFDLEKRARMQKLRVKPTRGILLYGPTGTGKTLLARTAANYVNANFFAINTPTIISKYLGESAQNIRELFESARQAAPSILYFDEITPLGSKRKFDAIDAEREVARTSEQFFAEMDGFEQNGNDNFNKGYVLVMASTNFYGRETCMSRILDDAFLRRFDKKIGLRPPTMSGKIKIAQVYLNDVPLENEVTAFKIASIVEDANSLATGSDIANISFEARRIALKREAEKVSIDDYMNSVTKYKMDSLM